MLLLDITILGTDFNRADVSTMLPAPLTQFSLPRSTEDFLPSAVMMSMRRRARITASTRSTSSSSTSTPSRRAPPLARLCALLYPSVRFCIICPRSLTPVLGCSPQSPRAPTSTTASKTSTLVSARTHTTNTQHAASRIPTLRAPQHARPCRNWRDGPAPPPSPRPPFFPSLLPRLPSPNLSP